MSSAPLSLPSVKSAFTPVKAAKKLTPNAPKKPQHKQSYIGPNVSPLILPKSTVQLSSNELLKLYTSALAEEKAREMTKVLINFENKSDGKNIIHNNKKGRGDRGGKKEEKKKDLTSVPKFMQTQGILEFQFVNDPTGGHYGVLSVSKNNRIATIVVSVLDLKFPFSHKTTYEGKDSWGNFTFKLVFKPTDEQSSQRGILKDFALYFCDVGPTPNAKDTIWCKFCDMCTTKDCPKLHPQNGCHYMPLCRFIDTERGCTDLSCKYFHHESLEQCKWGNECRGKDKFCKRIHSNKSDVVVSKPALSM